MLQFYKNALLIGNFFLFSSDPNIEASHELYRNKIRRYRCYFVLKRYKFSQFSILLMLHKSESIIVTENYQFKIEKQGCLILFAQTKV